MSVIVEDQTGKEQLITKGAIEEMIGVCAYAEYEGQVKPLTEDMKKVILKRVNEYNAKGFRVLGIAHKTAVQEKDKAELTAEKEMVLIGYLAFFDPPKATARGAINKLHEYGVKVKILTGDNDAASQHVCQEVGIPAEKILLGSDIETMSDEELSERTEGINVFAKLSPDQKTRIVSVLRKKHTVGFMPEDEDKIRRMLSKHTSFDDILLEMAKDRTQYNTEINTEDK